MQKRITIFDTVRGFTMISMAGFHACYDLAYLYDWDMPWFTQTVFQDIWRASISWVFLFIAGWMCTLSRNNAKRAAKYAAAALVVWIATTLVSVDDSVNFGIIYGQTEFGLSKELGIGRKEAKDYIESYFARYSGVKQWIDTTIQEARSSGISTTMMGRRRYIKDINSKNFNLRSFAERTAVNTPIQGTAADIIKIAMLQVQEQLKKRNFEAKMLLQVHDELIFEVPPQEIAGLIRERLA